jgi:phage baseplate assembly protein W
MNKKPLYKGISFRNFDKNKSITLYDVDLIHKDLENHIYTRRGERVKMFSYGTRIPDMVFEPMDDPIIEGMYDDLIAVFESEPRVQLQELKVTPVYDQNTLIATATLFYLELNFTGQFDIKLSFET